jgi:protein-disulfide isomerase
MRALAAALVAFASLAAAAGARAATDEDFSMGSAKAKVTVIEYASPTCPHCAHFNADVFPAFKKKWVDTGKVRYVLREAPIHPQIDFPAYMLARCAGPSNYFAVVDGMMKAQAQYMAPDLFNGPDADKKFFEAYKMALFGVAKSVGLDEPKTVACVTDQANADAMQKRVEREMGEYQVNSTPTFVVNGVKVTDQPADLAVLDKAIAKALPKALPMATHAGKKR